MMSLVDGSLWRGLSDAESLLLPREQWGELPARLGRVGASYQTWAKIGRVMLGFNIAVASPQGSQKVIDGIVVEHGVFCVAKAGHAKGTRPLGFVVNMPMFNAIICQINGIMSLLAVTNPWSIVTLEDNKIVLLSSSDAAIAFYIFLLPKFWHAWCCFAMICVLCFGPRSASLCGLLCFSLRCFAFVPLL